MAKKDIEEMAKELGIKDENLKFGLKKDAKNVEDAIKKAHAFLNKKR